MDQHLPKDSLHPNIARIAASYDLIIERMSNGQLTHAQARAQIEQLEARDDQGTRWGLDPDTGEFIRKTLLGDTQFDTPPAYGYQTDDAFSYSATRGNENDPNMRVEMFAAPDERLTNAPADLAGATRNGPAPHTSALGHLSALTKVPVAYKAAAAAVAIIVLLAFLLSG